MLGPESPGGKGLFYEIAQSVSEEFRESGKFPLDKGWINLQVEPILKAQGYRKEWFHLHPGLRWSHLTMLFAEPGFVLSMKVQALRPGKKDFGDVAKLVQVLGIKTLDQMEAKVDEYGEGWSFVGNKEKDDLKLAIAWAFPGETQYEGLRQQKLEQFRRIRHGNQSSG
jgi:hypothetical protein